MSYSKIMVHSVWGTKFRSSLLTNEVLGKVCNHIKENARKQKIFIDTINGHLDHLHCLAELNRELSISKQMQLIKGESSHWVNTNGLLPGTFSWAEDYYAVSVGEDELDWVRAYIQNQQEHHRKLTFQDEWESLMKRFRLMES